MIDKLKEIDRCFEAAIKNYECLNHEASRNCCIEGRRLIAVLIERPMGIAGIRAGLAEAELMECFCRMDVSEYCPVHGHHSQVQAVAGTVYPETIKLAQPPPITESLSQKVKTIQEEYISPGAAALHATFNGIDAPLPKVRK